MNESNEIIIEIKGNPGTERGKLFAEITDFLSSKDFITNELENYYRGDFIKVYKYRPEEAAIYRRVIKEREEQKG